MRGWVGHLLHGQHCKAHKTATAHKTAQLGPVQHTTAAAQTLTREFWKVGDCVRDEAAIRDLVGEPASSRASSRAIMCRARSRASSRASSQASNRASSTAANLIQLMKVVKRQPHRKAEGTFHSISRAARGGGRGRVLGAGGPQCGDRGTGALPLPHALTCEDQSSHR